MSVVVYGFFAFLLATGVSQRLRIFIGSWAILLIGAVASSRLYLGVITCWNYLFLTRILDQETDPARKEELIEAVRNGSVATWRHFNLHGEFDFSDEKMIDSVGLTKPKNPPTRKN